MPFFGIAAISVFLTSSQPISALLSILISPQLFSALLSVSQLSSFLVETLLQSRISAPKPKNEFDVFIEWFPDSQGPLHSCNMLQPSQACTLQLHFELFSRSGQRFLQNPQHSELANPPKIGRLWNGKMYGKNWENHRSRGLSGKICEHLRYGHFNGNHQTIAGWFSSHDHDQRLPKAQKRCSLRLLIVGWVELVVQVLHKVLNLLEFLGCCFSIKYSVLLGSLRPLFVNYEHLWAINHCTKVEGKKEPRWMDCWTPPSNDPSCDKKAACAKRCAFSKFQWQQTVRNLRTLGNNIFKIA